jgi:phosphoserine aminotransferase
MSFLYSLRHSFITKLSLSEETIKHIINIGGLNKHNDENDHSKQMAYVYFEQKPYVTFYETVPSLCLMTLHN